MKTKNRFSKVFALISAVSFIASGLVALDFGGARPALANTSVSAMSNGFQVSELASGGTLITVTVGTKYRGKSLSISKIENTNGEDVTKEIGKLKINKKGIGTLTVSQKLLVGDRLVLSRGRKNIIGSNITFIEVSGGPAASSPSAPKLETRLGTITVRWDGLRADSKRTPPQVKHLEVHVGSTPGFATNASTFSATIEKSGSDFHIITDLEYNTAAYVSLVFVYKNGKKSKPSASVPVSVTPLVDVDEIKRILDGASS
jgi:hypothetical protein